MAPMKSAFAAIVGRPSSGKSTLMNALCGHKVSIVSPVPQTTRNQVRGIVNRPDRGQIVFLDTPGFHLSEKKFNKSMMDNVTRAISDADVAVYLIDASRKAGSEEEGLLERLTTLRKPLVVALNKTELKPNYADELEAWVREKLSPKAVVRISALAEVGLDAFFDAIFENSPEGEAFYPEEFYTDQDPSFRIAEIVREQAINRLADEIPHALYVEVADRELKEAPPAEGAKPQPTLWLRVFLIVERESQVGIVVGKGGEKIKLIRQAAQKELGKVFSQRIHLDLRCKADPKWRSNDVLIKGILGSSQPKP
jgi:GTP-binding protein Era